ncbi:MAG: DUF4397 domain-containing protein [Pseudomonadota bacterium]
MFFKTSISKLVLVMAPLALLAACGGGNDDDVDDRADIADPKVRFVNAVPLSPSLTLFRGAAEQPDARDAGYKFASRYYDTSTSNATWTVRTTSGLLDVASVGLEPSRGNKYTLVALPGSSSVELVSIRDPYNKGLVSDRARVRVLNASFTRSDLDVYLTPPTASLASVTPTFSGVTYRNTVPASGSDSLEFPGGDYQMRITSKDNKTVLFSAPVNLANNADWLVVTLPDLTVSGGIKVLVVKSDDADRITQEITTQ